MTESLDLADLADWRRQIAEMYARIRKASSPHDGWEDFKRARDQLFKSHPQSPLDEAARSQFARLEYFGYSPAFRATAELVQCEAIQMQIGASDGSTYHFTRFATAHFEAGGNQGSLDLYWLQSYAGGIFVPFRDATCGDSTYGGGRYLLDTPKGADLGMKGGKLVLDFNFAYHPSCSYDSRWSCPLAPPGNRLSFAVTAGERLPS